MMSDVVNVFDHKEVVLTVKIENEAGNLIEKELTIKKVKGKRALNGLAALLQGVDLNGLSGQDGVDLNIIKGLFIGAAQNIDHILSYFVDFPIDDLEYEDLINVVMTVIKVNDLGDKLKNLPTLLQMNK